MKAGLKIWWQTVQEGVIEGPGLASAAPRRRDQPHCSSG